MVQMVAAPNSPWNNTKKPNQTFKINDKNGFFSRIVGSNGNDVCLILPISFEAFVRLFYKNNIKSYTSVIFTIPMKCKMMCDIYLKSLDKTIIL